MIHISQLTNSYLGWVWGNMLRTASAALKGPEMTMSPNGIEFLKAHEGCKLTAYRDTKGVCTIGYGDTHGVHDGMTITQEEADERLRTALATAEASVDKIKIELTTNEADALISLVYNIGATAFEKSTLFWLLQMGRKEAAPTQFMRWVHQKGTELPVPGLVNRRRDEVELWNTE